MTEFDFDMNTKYLKIIQSANANGVTIYTLDATGLSTPDVLSADNRQSDVQVNDFTFRQNMQGPIRMMAEETGGIAAINTNDWKSSLDQVAADFSNFYSLGYRAARGATDRPHKIDVEVKGKGLHVRFRQSFVEKSVETRTAEAVVSSLSYPRTDNPLQASLSVGQAKPYDRENYSLPVRISLPIGKLGMVPSGDQYEGQFFVYFVVQGRGREPVRPPGPEAAAPDPSEGLRHRAGARTTTTTSPSSWSRAGRSCPWECGMRSPT